MTVKLTCCQRIIRGRGKHRSVRENILWQEEQGVPGERILFTPTGAAIPVHFALPADARETTASKGSEGVFWALIVDASLPGVDLHEDFDVPVAGGAMPERPVQYRRALHRAKREGGGHAPGPGCRGHPRAPDRSGS